MVAADGDVVLVRAVRKKTGMNEGAGRLEGAGRPVQSGSA
jgi:hypothetical protein